MFIYKIVFLALFISDNGITMPMPAGNSAKKVTQCQKLWVVRTRIMQCLHFSRLTYIQLIGTYELNILHKIFLKYEIDKNCSNHDVVAIGFSVLYFHHHR